MRVGVVGCGIVLLYGFFILDNWNVIFLLLVVCCFFVFRVWIIVVFCFIVCVMFLFMVLLVRSWEVCSNLLWYFLMVRVKLGFFFVWFLFFWLVVFLRVWRLLSCICIMRCKVLGLRLDRFIMLKVGSVLWLLVRMGLWCGDF